MSRIQGIEEPRNRTHWQCVLVWAFFFVIFVCMVHACMGWVGGYEIDSHPMVPIGPHSPILLYFISTCTCICICV